MAATFSAPFDAEAALAPLLQLRPKRSDAGFLHAISTTKRVRTCKVARQPALSSDTDAEEDADAHTSGEGSDVRDTKVSAVKPRKRIPTHVLRKKEKDEVLKELKLLETRAAALRREHGIEDPNVAKKSWTINYDLREAILQRDLVLASTQSALSGYMNARVMCPIETCIHLTKNWDQRRAVLLSMKDQKIRDARRFLTKRTRHMDMRKPSCEVSQFESENGDQCTLKIDVTHFAGVASVRQVFEALQFYYFNLEITVTEMSGMLTVRENEDSTEKSVLHHCLCIAHPSGYMLEKNYVCFMDSSGLESENVDEHTAIVTGDFVDQDDLYPYSPRERLRKDVTTAMQLSAFRRPKASRKTASSPTSGQEEETELVVVLTRWYLARIRKPEIAMENNVLQTISNEQSAEVDIMVKSMRQGMLLS
uniref:Uncharacterized protein n=1 Tax=Globisporangium ultimum (strain ATCC 200006 / CBS 805.95 / DAOM BR144) TaxID=431595 RepID=K3X3B9_GLOUD